MNSDEKYKFNDIDSLLNNVFQPQVNLRNLFDKRLLELDINITNVLDILSMERRTLNGILDGTQKRVDFVNLIKIANFLHISKEQVFKLYSESLEKNFPNEMTSSPEKIKFIKENFDLVALKKGGLIESISDFDQIEKAILKRLGLKSIFEYAKPSLDVAFSSGLFKPKNELTRSFWIQSAKTCFEEINNPFEYDRQGLISFFPQIRWHSMNVELGLLEIVKALYRLGITVIYQPPLPGLQLRGATFSVNEKPCIVLTNYLGFYPTLWFALIHELYHVLFDWEEISINYYHLTDDSNDQLSVKERENEADNFAREYLFSLDKMNQIKPYINDDIFIKEFAAGNHVHPSIIYVFQAFQANSNDRMAWARARKHSPDVEIYLNKLDLPWEDKDPLNNTLNKIKQEIYTS